MRTITANVRYVLVNQPVLFHSRCNHVAATSLPISRVLAITTTDMNAPEKILANPMIEKYAATVAILIAVMSVKYFIRSILVVSTDD